MPPLTPQNIAAAQPLQTATRGWIAQLVWSPTGNLFAAASAGGVALWRGSLESRAMFIKQHDGPVKSIAFAPNGTTIATASADTTVKVWDLRAFSPAMQPIEVYDEHHDAVEHVLIARNGAVISSSVDGTVRVRHRQRRLSLTAHEGEVNVLALSHDHRLLASGGRDNTVRLWDTLSGKGLALLDAHADWIRALAFHPSEDVLLSASRDGTARLWDVSDPNQPEVTHVLAHKGDVRAACFDSTGEMVVTGSTDNVITTWHAGERLATLEKHTKPVISLAFHPQNSLLASGSGDNTICLWGIM